MKSTTKAFFWVITLLAIIVVSTAKDCKKQEIGKRARTIGLYKSARKAEKLTDHPSFRASANRMQAFYKVARVVDGDTIQLDNGEKVRYIGVDTPETKHPRKPVEYFGKEASAKNKNLVGGKKVRLEFDVQKRDRYRRLLAYVYLDDGTFVNAELVSLGYAKVWTIPPNVRYQELFIQLQREAQKAKRGLWQKE